MSDAPQIQDDPGSADEWIARTILLVPWVTLLLAVVGVISATLTGLITFDVAIEGTLSVQYLFNTFAKPLYYGLLAIFVGSYVLAAAKEWGIKPIQWLANAAEGYNPRNRQ